MKAGSLPVGDNWCGPSDLAGNVWAWCADWYGNDYYAGSPQDDPSGPANGTDRALRGGAFDGVDVQCPSADRYKAPPLYLYFGFGFRVAKTT